jgi:hypothetical protein
VYAGTTIPAQHPSACAVFQFYCLTWRSAESGMLPARAGLLSASVVLLPGRLSSRSNDTSVPRAGSSQAPLMVPRERPLVRVTTCLFSTCTVQVQCSECR